MPVDGGHHRQVVPEVDHDVVPLAELEHRAGAAVSDTSTRRCGGEVARSCLGGGVRDGDSHRRKGEPDLSSDHGGLRGGAQDERPDQRGAAELGEAEVIGRGDPEAGEERRPPAR